MIKIYQKSVLRIDSVYNGYIRFSLNVCLRAATGLSEIEIIKHNESLVIFYGILRKNCLYFAFWVFFWVDS